jgi:hypothetical protein
MTDSEQLSIIYDVEQMFVYAPMVNTSQQPGPSRQLAA